MAILALSMAALGALALPVPPAVAGSPRGLAIAAQVRPIARRSAGGASATATISARIVSSSARVGAGLPPPANLVARAATVTAADGRAVPALIYDFE